MKTELHNYDIYPKVVLTGAQTRFTIHPLGAHAALSGEYQVSIHPLADASPLHYPERGTAIRLSAAVNSRGDLAFDAVLSAEGEYFIRLFRDDQRVLQMSVYALENDMRGRLPFRGDLHVHSFHSDGRQSPAVVCANYRKYGYDFISITDHRRYYPSLEAIDAYRDVPCELTIVPGEEIHLPGNDIHTVNFGAEYSINGLLESSAQTMESTRRAIVSNPPPVRTDDEYRAEVTALISELEIPDCFPESEKFSIASCNWIFRRIKEGNGLGIYTHPYWISDMFQVPETITDYLAETHPFDAYEVLGGENYFRQNGFQTVRYYEDRAKGRKYPIVGSTDSHNSIAEDNRNALICSTFVFAKANERVSLIEAIKDSYSVAVDTISPEYRIVGDFRLVKYTRFILDEFTPLHDALCFEEGRLMKDYISGDEYAADGLRHIHGRMARLFRKYFAL